MCLLVSVVTAYIPARSLSSDFVAHSAYVFSDFVLSVSLAANFITINLSAKLISRNSDLQGSVGKGVLPQTCLHPYNALLAPEST